MISSKQPGNQLCASTNLFVLECTQEYLQSLVARQVPNSLLEHAWQEFYGIYSDLIRRFVIARGLPESDVDDCVQEVWSAVATKLVDFQHPQNRPGLRAWLYALVRSKAIDVWRRKARHPSESPGQAIELEQVPGSSEQDAVDSYERDWQAVTLAAMLSELERQLPEVNYRLLQMRVIEGRKVAEVAAKLNLTPEVVRYRQHRILRKLRARLALYTGKPFGENA